MIFSLGLSQASQEFLGLMSMRIDLAHRCVYLKMISFDSPSNSCRSNLCSPFLFITWRQHSTIHLLKELDHHPSVFIQVISYLMLVFLHQECLNINDHSFYAYRSYYWYLDLFFSLGHIQSSQSIQIPMKIIAIASFWMYLP